MAERSVVGEVALLTCSMLGLESVSTTRLKYACPFPVLSRQYSVALAAVFSAYARVVSVL